jgi:hypothetical protein
VGVVNSTFTVGAMKVADATELARSLSNEILGNLHKDLIFFTDRSPAY